MFMLNYLSLKLALEHCDYSLAMELFNMIKGSYNTSKTNNCGCHG